MGKKKNLSLGRLTLRVMIPALVLLTGIILVMFRSIFDIKPYMVTHPMKMVHWISIVVIHIFIMLKPKDAELIMIVQLICGTAV